MMTPSTQTDDATTRTDAGSLLRPRYAPGLVLMDTDLETAVTYQLDRSRLILRALLGCGVICGLRVTAKLEQECQRLSVTVACGLALDGCGDPVEVKNPVTLKLEKRCGTWPADQFWVVLRRREWRCEPRASYLPCEEAQGESEPTRIREGFELKLAREKPCLCWTRPSEADCASPNEAEIDREERLGKCLVCPPCECGCDDWVLLATLIRETDSEKPNDLDDWKVDHGGRRWLRPVLQADPLAGVVVGTAATEQNGRAEKSTDAAAAKIPQQPKGDGKGQGKN
jgi:hypothetical protein